MIEVGMYFVEDQLFADDGYGDAGATCSMVMKTDQAPSCAMERAYTRHELVSV